ncbi:mechanosensitive ion channel protein MscS [Rhodanobacter thiooxydans]|uniref:Small-conductance mechanosensitive channel n=1 Tax=Rhodanobacter thiooxydans TaxID=416169 RepID=A0A154QCF1_9GAMM|nr:mechanosensitive ion channel domain-containing protein [Rhodanobacter thiooxydans]EIL97680.1 small-conductance mechanosensitive channel [Rhodanobacter thiooxydans LCS2]KZC21904.1 mechanosensitive ion channel protein MscS [Rhodanobacter thiooxydans]MCW0203946.1 mechanosensitive ion channel [Rhodanobacter thiooxydans]
MFDVSAAPVAADAMSTYTDQAMQLGLRLLGALVVLLVGMWVASRLANFARAALGRANLDSTLSGFLRNLIYGVLVVLLVVTALGVLGVPSAPMVAALGTAGLAVGLALQGSLSNLAWGVLLVLFRPFRVGDYVSAGGTEGTVQSINLMHTQLLLPDNREAILPNAKVGGDAIINYNRRGTRRFELKLGIAYRDDAEQVMAAIRQLMAADRRILKDPAPGVWIENLSGQTVNLVLRGWTLVSDGWDAQTDLLHAIKRQIDAQQISIPVGPQQVTLVHGNPGPGGA